MFVIAGMIWAYLTDRLPSECYNAFDNAVLGRAPRAHDGPRVHAFRSWLLAMSDQQLVSGLALAIALNMLRNGVGGLDLQVTGYAYNNAVILAFFSCMIHLASLGILRAYLRERGALKHVRVALMLCVFLLILQGLAETWQELDPFVSLRCAVAEFYATGYLVYFSDEGSLSVWGNISTVMGLTTLLALLASGYVRRIWTLYAEGGDKTLSYRMVLLCAAGGIASETQLGTLKEAERDLARRWSRSKSVWTWFWFAMLPCFSRSFLFEIIWLLLYFAIGLGQLAYYLVVDYDEPLSSRISTRPDFGQLLPVILLGLPVLSFLEVHSGTSYKIKPR